MRLWNRNVLTAVVTAAVCCFLAATVIKYATQKQKRKEASQHLKGILHELHILNDINGRLPHAIELAEDGSPMHSWRFVTCRNLLGDISQCEFYGQSPTSAYELAWDSPSNKRYYDGHHRNYSGSPTSFIDPSRPFDRTRFVAITGVDTAFDSHLSIDLRTLPADLVIIVETRNSHQHWMEPGGDLDVGTLHDHYGEESGDGVSGSDPEGFLVGFANGEVWLLLKTTPFEVISPFLKITSAGKRSKESVLAPYRIEL
jgi:hypothetical protein